MILSNIYDNSDQNYHICLKQVRIEFSGTGSMGANKQEGHLSDKECRQPTNANADLPARRITNSASMEYSIIL